MAEQNKGSDDLHLPVELSLLPVRDIVMYPYTILPLFVGREKSIRAVDDAISRGRIIMLATQKTPEVDDPQPEHLYNFGTISMIMRLLKLPDNRVKILVQGLMRAQIIDYIQTNPFYKVRVNKIPEKEMAELPVEVEALMRNVRAQLERIVNLGRMVMPDVVVIANNVNEPGRLADLVVSNLSLNTVDTQQVLEIVDPVQRLRTVSELLAKEIEILTVQQKIQTQAKEEIDKNQREYFLRQQLKAIQHELGMNDEHTEEINELTKKITEAGMPELVQKEADKQLSRLSKMHPDAAEAGIIRSYVEWLVEVPWSKSTEDMLDLKQAAKVLDEDHYDLEKVKERILEYLAVRKLSPNMKGPILCFVGPPGVGKTSLGRSIARALGRKFVRISLGGVRDEAEIRGHRRTYIGALPGRIIQGIKQAGTNNPVFMMDEVDKIGADFRGDPSAALLEVLDPEQNFAFSDHYLGVPFDLSKVMFITTANILDTIQPAFRDRMEILYLSGYTEEEKLKIARQFIIPKQLKENGITDAQLNLSDSALKKGIEFYTREAGLRNLEREIGTICRKVAKEVAEGKTVITHVAANNINKYLGIPKFIRETENKQDTVGVATGLAWTESGGDIIHVEATIMKGKGSLILTGHLGDVMKESAQAALSYTRSRSGTLGIDESFYAQNDIHIHVPAGAIPKDGPSAGVTMTTALVSALTGRAVRKDIAMTGEVTLRGKVLPVGGIKSKVLAARRVGIDTVILPEENEKDLENIPDNVKRHMNFILAQTVDDVIDKALVAKQPA
ncbi:MAG: endopeptidase La [Candidatus Schekmanbacteria bacterium]|nr:endopeptidase La [Candidatus Schekmanbacteria bacterium]